MNERGLCRDSLLATWRPWGRGRRISFIRRLDMQVPPGRCGTSRRRPGFCRPCLRRLGRFDPIRGPQGLRHGPKRKLVVASLIGTLNQLKSRPTALIALPRPLLHAARKPSYVSFTADLPFRVTRVMSSPPLHDICTAIFLLFTTHSGVPQPLALGSLHPSFLAPRRQAHPPQTRPNLGGVKDLSVSRSEVITVVPGTPLPPCYLSGLGENQSRRVRGTAWQVDSTASSPGADIAGPGNWPHWLSNAPAAKPNLLLLPTNCSPW